MNMVKQTISAVSAILAVALNANAACLIDAPEIGDIGPDSELVCSALQSRFPGSRAIVDGRSIQSPTEVSVFTSVDGTSVRMFYRLVGHAWRLSNTDISVTDVSQSGAGLSMR